MSISAMKQALEALIWTTGSGDFGEGGQAREGALKCLFPAITALRQAIAEAEKQEPVANEQAVIDKFLGNSFPMLSAITEQPKQEPVAKYSDIVSDGGLDPRNVHAIDISQERVDETAKDRHEWVGQPDLARVGEVGIWGEEKNT